MKKVSQLFFLNVCNLFKESSLYDLTYIFDTAFRDKLKDLLDNYKQNKTENTNLKISIILKDDVPDCWKPRRFAFSEKIHIDKQIDVWIKEGIISESTSKYGSLILVPRKKIDRCKFA